MRLVLQLKSKKTEKKYKFSEYFFALIFIIPYMEIGIMNDLSYKKNGLYLPFIEIVMIVLGFVFLFYYLFSINKNPIGKIKMKELKILLIHKVIFDMFLLARIMFSENLLMAIFQLSYITVPFYFALIALLIIIKRNINIVNIMKIGIFYFTLYCLVAYIYNIFVLKIDLFSTISSRLVTPGGGPVILGYTIVIIISLIFIIRDKQQSIKYYLQLSILIFVSFATGSRGSMWPVSLLVLIFILQNRNIKKKIIIINMLLILVIIIRPINLIIEYVPRFGMNISSDSARVYTALNSLIIFSQESIDKILLGFGVGQFFPYQQWQILFNPYISNIFYYKGYPLLVQPHNTYIYLLLESGLLGLILFMNIIIYCIRICLKKQLPILRNGIISILLLLLLCFFDSLLVIHPASSSQLWFIILLVVSLKEYDLKNEKEYILST